MATLKAPFPYFGGKSKIAPVVWKALGSPLHYIEPFCGSAAMLLAAPKPAGLEVISDMNYFVANFWRAVKFNPSGVYAWQDYPVSHVDLGARHRWLVDPERTAELAASLEDPDWPGDAKIAGWWVWGACAWIGNGWCEGGVPDGIAHGQVPRIGGPGASIQSLHMNGKIREWIGSLSNRLARVRVVHGDWIRCMNTYYGVHNAGQVSVFFDPPYKTYEKTYRDTIPVASAAEEWCREHDTNRIALCGHDGDYDLPGWTVHAWERLNLTMGSTKTRDLERIWFSPACLDISGGQQDLF